LGSLLGTAALSSALLHVLDELLALLPSSELACCNKPYNFANWRSFAISLDADADAVKMAASNTELLPHEALSLLF
jgi:hypothetical protein